jgi:hypothetical protein
MAIHHLFALVLLGGLIWSIPVIGFLLGYVIKRDFSILAFLIGFVISISYVAILMNTSTSDFLFFLELFFVILIWAGFGPGFVSYGTAILGRRLREREKPFITKKEFVGIGIISVFVLLLILLGRVLPLYYPSKLYPQIIYTYSTYGTYPIIALTAFIYGMWSKERRGIMSFMVAYFPFYVLGGVLRAEGSWLCFPIGALLGLAGLAGWLMSKLRSVRSV